jgi:glutamine amidotransferase
MSASSTAVIIDYGSGNLRSAAKACARAASEAGLAVEPVVTADPDRVRRASHVILPGVGAFADCRRGLLALPGMAEVLEEVAIRQGRPFLGICVGMQLMAERGFEHGEHRGLGWLAGDVVALAPPPDSGLKVPHMGWNDLAVLRPDHPVLAGIAGGDHAYFVHSYRFVGRRSEDILATVDYGGTLAAVVGRDSLVGTQFHPEKSQATGLRLLANFLAWHP